MYLITQVGAGENGMVKIYGDTYLSRKYGKAVQEEYAPSSPDGRKAAKLRVQHGSKLICSACGCDRCMEGRRLGAALGSTRPRYLAHARSVKDGRVGR